MDTVFSCGTDTGNLGLRVYLRTDNLLRLEGIFAPEMRSVPQLHLVVINPEVNRFIRLTREDDVVIAGKLKLGGKATAKIRTAQEATFRRLCGNLGTASRDRCATQRPCPKDESIGGTHRVNTGQHFVIEDFDINASATEEISGIRTG
jgi:hypothetical protein